MTLNIFFQIPKSEMRNINIQVEKNATFVGVISQKARNVNMKRKKIGFIILYNSGKPRG